MHGILLSTRSQWQDRRSKGNDAVVGGTCMIMGEQCASSETWAPSMKLCMLLAFSNEPFSSRLSMEPVQLQQPPRCLMYAKASPSQAPVHSRGQPSPGVPAVLTYQAMFSSMRFESCALDVALLSNSTKAMQLEYSQQGTPLALHWL